MNILVVDDEVLIREVIKEYSLIEDYEVVEAENGIQALEIIEKELVEKLRTNLKTNEKKKETKENRWLGIGYMPSLIATKLKDNKPFLNFH